MGESAMANSSDVGSLLEFTFNVSHLDRSAFFCSLVDAFYCQMVNIISGNTSHGLWRSRMQGRMLFRAGGRGGGERGSVAVHLRGDFSLGQHEGDGLGGLGDPGRGV